MSLKHKKGGKCRLCGCTVEKGKTICKACEAWEKAGYVPITPGRAL